MTVKGAIKRLEAARIAFGRVSTLDDFMRHSALATTTCQAGNDSITLVGAPTVTNGQRGGGGQVPSLGEHNVALRAEYG
jgi:crotonobetainyl-CoA:carnitine CoA-transferase CaiB-like acyl-CoA transferase